MKSDVTVGQSTSPSDVFDSVPYTGVELKSDSDMLPDSEKGYAPIIRGSAHSNALVMVRQNGYVIYQNTVAPGAFEINDLYPTGSSGDLRGHGERNRRQRKPLRGAVCLRAGIAA